MNYSLYALMDKPFEGFFPQDLKQWLDAGVSDEQLSEAYAAVSNHCSALMHLTDDDDLWGRQAFDDWQEVELNLVSLIIAGMDGDNMIKPVPKGYHHVIVPFMLKHGYRDLSGCWRKEKS